MKDFTEKTDSAIEKVAKDKLKRDELNKAIYGGAETISEYMRTVRVQGSAYEQYEMQGRRKQLGVIAEVYAMWAALTHSGNVDAFSALKKKVEDAYEVDFKADSETTSVVLRYAFEGITHKQVSVIGKVMRYCYEHDITYDGFVAYVSSNGGLEGVRSKAYKAEQEAAEAAAVARGETVQQAATASVDSKCVDKLKAEVTIDELDSSTWLDGEQVRVMFAVRNGETAELKNVLLDANTTAQMLKLYMKQAKAEVSFELLTLEKEASDAEYNKGLAKQAATQALVNGDAGSYRALHEQIKELNNAALDARAAVERKKKELKVA